MRYEKLISLNICALRFNPDKRQGREQEQGIGRSCFMTAAPSTRSTHTGLPRPLCSWLRMWMEGASVAVEIANLRVFILMSFYFDFNASSKCVRRFLIFFPASPSCSSSAVAVAIAVIIVIFTSISTSIAIVIVIVYEYIVI